MRLLRVHRSERHARSNQEEIRKIYVDAVIAIYEGGRGLSVTQKDHCFTKAQPELIKTYLE